MAPLCFFIRIKLTTRLSKLKIESKNLFSPRDSIEVLHRQTTPQKYVLIPLVAQDLSLISKQVNSIIVERTFLNS